MTKRPEFLLHGLGLLLLTTILFAGWWLAGRSDSRPTSQDSAASRAKRLPSVGGPQDRAYCASPGVALPPPPVDNPFGLHLYATTPKGIITPLKAIEIVQHLGLPGDLMASASPLLNRAAPSLPLAPGSPTSESNRKNETAFDDVQSVSMLLQEYRRAFGAMPVGELNDEIVRRLQGENPKGIAVLPKSHPAINAQGELIDRWGTPYRFHPESAWDTTVRSAGPDRRMWTQDDVLSEGLSGGDIVLR